MLMAFLSASAQFNPANPPEPEGGLSYTLTTASLPANGGSTSPGTQKVKAGLAVTLSASASSNYSFVEWQDEEGKSVSAERSFKIVMPEKNVKYVAVFRYTPGSPAEPQTPQIQAYKNLVTSVEPANAGYVSNGGRYAVGASIKLSASSYSDYVFEGWSLNGTRIEETSSTYTHVMQDGDNNVTAHFRYSPSSPAEPVGTPVKYPLTLLCSPSNAGYISPASGTKYAKDANVSLSASMYSDYVFEAWLDEEGSVLSTERSFTYQMPGKATALTVKFRYSPGSPGEPSAPAPTRNIIYGGREVVLPGAAGIFNINLENKDGINGINVDLALPAGLTFDMENASPAQRAGLGSLSIEPLEGEGTWRLQLRSEEVFPGANGALIRIPFKVDPAAEPGTVYTVTMTHGVIYRPDGSQDAVTATDGQIKVVPQPDVLPDSPDFQVINVEADAADVMPGDVVSFRWKVTNKGTLASESGWSEALFLTDASGKRVVLGNVFYDGNGLKPGEEVSRSATLTIPALPGLSGKLNAGVTVSPYLASDESAQLQANNTTVGSGFPITLGKQLILTLPVMVTEGEDSNIRGQIARSGSWDESETFTLQADHPDGRMSFPETVTIPRDQSAAWFQITLSPNDVSDPASVFKFTAKGNGYGDAQAAMTVRDSRLPMIELTLNPEEATEGESVTLTAAIPFALDKDIELSLTSVLAGRIILPSSIKIPAGNVKASVTVTAFDNTAVDGDQEVPIIASAEGFESGAVYLSVIDNDLPHLEMTLTPDEVNENAGALAIRGVITRTDNFDKKVTIDLSTESTGQIIFPTRRLLMEAGVRSVEFSVGVIDNDKVDGDRTVDVTAAVYISTCSCTAAGQSAGAVSKSIRIIDNDGPSLTLISSQSAVAEGEDKGITVTVKRNADFDKALEVTLTCDPAGSLTFPATVIIPQGMESASFSVSAPLNEVTDDDRTVVLSVKAEGYAPSNLWVMVTDRTLPDARIPSLSLSAEEATAGSDVDVTLTLANSGLMPLPAQTCVAIYTGNDVAQRLWLQEPLAAGESMEFTRTIKLPAKTGICPIYAIANPNGEFKEMNMGDNRSVSKEILLVSPFKAGVTLDRNIVGAGESVTIKGHLDSMPEEGTEVEIYVINEGVRHTLTAKTLADGSFEGVFTPYAGEIGNFAVGACYPGEGLKDRMATFEIPGLKRESKDYLTCDAIVGSPYTFSFIISNPCGIEMTGLKAQFKGMPEGLKGEVKAPEQIAGGFSLPVEVAITADRPSSGKDWEKFSLVLTSAEKGELEVPLYWYARSAKGELKGSVSAIEVELPDGETIEYPVTISNNGAGETGQIEVVLPDWMKCAGPTRLPSLSPGEEMTVTLLLKATDQMALNHKVSGQLAVNCENGKGIIVKYSAMPVSNSPAAVEVSACDEFTYNTAEAPKVAGAMVKIVNPGTGKTVAEGLTDDSGVFKTEVAAGYYRVDVSAEKHQSWSGTVFMNPGKTNKVTANISFNPITISYTVVPTEVEDEYLIETTARFEVNLPVPIVRTIAPKRIDGDNMQPGESTIINIQMVNEGLMTAYNVQPVFEKDNPEWDFELLDHKEPFELAAHQLVNIPVRVTRKANINARLQGATGRDIAHDMVDMYRGCMTHIVQMYEVMCEEPISKNEAAASMAMKFCATAATMGSILNAISDLIGGGPGGPGGLGAGGGGGASSNYQGVGGEASFSICDPCDAEKAEKVIDQLISTAGGPLSVFWSAVDFAVKMYRNQGKEIKVIKDKIKDDAKSTAADMAVDNGGNILGWVVTIVEISKPCEEDSEKTPTAKTSTPASRKPLQYATRSEEAATPSFRHSWQEVFYNETNNFMEGWNAAVEFYTKFFGDPVWMLDPTEDKVKFMDYVATLPAGTKLSDEELKKVKPESVSLDQARLYLESCLEDEVTEISGEELGALLDKIGEYDDAAKAAGYENLADRILKAYAAYQSEFDKLKNNSVCASVVLRFSQTMTMTREAFRGTLEVYNGHESIAMKDVKLNLTIEDPEGKEATSHEFQMNPETLAGFNGELDLTSGWTLAAGERGIAEVLFIPTKYAAPDMPVVWTFGGSLTYIDPFTDLEVTRRLQPVSLTVHPSPVLDMTYFLQRDVYSDDPLTADVVESGEDAEFALVIHNVGAGEAKNVKLVTEQPQIIENEKGILLDTEFVSSQLNGAEKHLALGGSMASDFGTIPAGGSAYAQWWFRSSLIGHFTEYDVKATHVTSYGNPDLSLLGNVEIHELIRGITDPDAPADAPRRLFLANDIVDVNDSPDMVYFSDATECVGLNGAVVSSEMTGRTTYDVKVLPQIPGWVYANIADPTGGRLRLLSVTRLSDGVELPADNFWQTAVTLRDGQNPIHETLLHIAVNTGKEDTYRLLFEERPNGTLEVESITGIPSDLDGPVDPVKTVCVSFTKEVEENGFTSDALKLTRGGERLDLDEVVITRTALKDFNVDLGDLTKYEGYYVLTVDASALKDKEGYAGSDGKSKGWLQKGEAVVGVDEISASAAGFAITPVPVRERMTLSGDFTTLKRLTIHDSAGKLMAEWNNLDSEIGNGQGVVSVPIEVAQTDVMVVTAVTESGKIYVRRVLFVSR